MEQYIKKSALLAEIKRYKHKADERLKIKGRSLAEERKDSALQNLCGNLLHFIDTHAVKEVNLDKEIDKWYNNEASKEFENVLYEDIEKYAKHFFKLGLNKEQKNIWHTMDETPNYPCDILLVTDVNNMFLYRYMENGRPVDRETPYLNNILNGKCWCYCNDIINK